MKDDAQKTAGLNARQITHVSDIPATDVQRSMKAIYHGQLRGICLTIAIYYLFAGTSHALYLSDTLRVVLATAAAFAMAVALLVYWGARTGRIPVARADLAFMPVILSVFGNVYLHVFLTGDQMQLTNGVLVMLGLGIVTLNQRIYWSLTVLNIVLFSGLAVYLPGEYSAHLLFMFVASLMLSILAFTERYRTVYKMEQLLLFSRIKNRELIAAKAEADAQTQEAERAADEARKANAAKDVFLANTSHELRTPLTGVLGMMDVLEQTSLTGEQRELVDAAQLSARTLLTIINDILDLAKMDAGQLKLEIKPFRLDDVIRTVVDLMEPRAREKGLLFQLESDAPEGLSVLSDSIRLGQILFNLIGNAIKFTETGRVVFSISAHRDEDTCDLVFRVRDTGIGFNPQDAAFLFERFQQADGSSARKQGGTGLGLAISQQLAERLGGDITADSKPGEGSVFTLRLSLPVVAAGAIEEAVRKGEAEDTIKGLSLRILVAEDNHINQLLVRKLLAPYGWRLSIVENGAQALATLEEDPDFDIVLMDARMPVMDGPTATQLIRAKGGVYAEIPIIALTANTMAEDRIKYLRAGMNTLVGKPIQMDELVRAIKASLGEKPSEA